MANHFRNQFEVTGLMFVRSALANMTSYKHLYCLRAHVLALTIKFLHSLCRAYRVAYNGNIKLSCRRCSKEHAL